MKLSEMRCAWKRLAAAVLAAVLLCQSAVYAAEYNFAYPTAPTKKGVHVAPGMEEDALELKKLVLEEYPEADVKINSCTGLCSFYAERGGLIIGFEV